MDKRRTLTVFSDLLGLRPDIPIGEQQRLASELFPSVVSQSHMRHWQLGEPIPQTGARVLIGVAASYSVEDLALLDALELRLRQTPKISDEIHVFDISVCRDMADLQNYFPDIGKIYQTPIVGLWQNGQLIDKAWGVNAKKLLEERYGLKLTR